MTDAAAPIAIAGRSLWADAWGRLRANKAAVASAIYLALVVLLCAFGPLFTGHEFTTIYQSYVRVPPSLEAYPKADAIEQELKTR